MPPNEPSPPAIAVKAFIVDKGRVLILKRNKSRPHAPGAYDIPGGRLEQGENPIEGLKRETFEETGLKISVGQVIGLHYFRRGDSQIITMLIFLCKPKSRKISLGKSEMDSFEWAKLSEESTGRKLGKFSRHLSDFRKVWSKQRGTPVFFDIERV